MNTVYIHPHSVGRDPLKVLIKELTHAKQRNDAPARFAVQVLKACGHIAVSMMRNRHDVFKAYDELYDMEGSFEYEAHKIIEPKLKERYQELMEERRGPAP